MGRWIQASRTLGMFSLAILSGDEGATTLANTGSGNLIAMGKTRERGR